jgi:hypothetical protein
MAQSWDSVDYVDYVDYYFVLFYFLLLRIEVEVPVNEKGKVVAELK